MKTRTRQKIAMARRALDFALAHPIDDKGYTIVVTRLQAEVERADKAAMLQDTGTVEERAATTHRLDLKQEVRSHHLVRLCKIAAIAAREHHELKGRFPLPRIGGPGRTFITRAQLLLEAATEFKDLLTAYGLGDNFIEELSAALAEYNSDTTTSHGARADHVGALSEVQQLANDCSADVTVLDTFMKRNFRGDPATLEAWRSARNLVAPFTPKPAAPAPAPEPPVALTVAEDRKVPERG